MDYAKNYERCCLEPINPVQRWFIGLMARKARAIGQRDHKCWPLKYVIDVYLSGRENLRILDCGAWNGWFLSYESSVIRRRVALDFDAHYAGQLVASGIDFVLADMEKGALPFAGDAFDLVAMTSTLEHLGNVEAVASEIHRVLAPGGVVYITVPNVLKYRFHFWDDVTHKRPFTPGSLRFLFETHGFETVTLCPYNHNLFVAGNLFPRAIHERMLRFRGKALMYAGRKPRS